MKPVLTFDKVSMTYYTKANETQALKDLSFDLFKGEFMSVLGPSGCGKTTLLSLASGTLKPTQGQILLDGKQVTKTSTDVGYMLQRDHLFEWRTIY
ncbi:MAG: ATP-binding cassette domain-containing protein, partial [Clostridia bacterium]|nr:ATP-binding cassette domain-containing protein [Clostridia bacterium]